MRLRVSADGKDHDLEITQSDEQWHCRIDGRDVQADFVFVGNGAASILAEGHSFLVRREHDGAILVDGRRYEVAVEDPRSLQARKRRELGASGPLRLTATMPGKVVRVLAREGDAIQAGQGIVVVEAMKMQNEIKSVKAGTLKKLVAREGANVNAGELLAVIE